MNEPSLKEGSGPISPARTLPLVDPEFDLNFVALRDSYESHTRIEKDLTSPTFSAGSEGDGEDAGMEMLCAYLMDRLAFTDTNVEGSDERCNGIHAEGEKEERIETRREDESPRNDRSHSFTGLTNLLDEFKDECAYSTTKAVCKFLSESCDMQCRYVVHQIVEKACNGGIKLFLMVDLCARVDMAQNLRICHRGNESPIVDTDAVNPGILPKSPRSQKSLRTLLTKECRRRFERTILRNSNADDSLLTTSGMSTDAANNLLTFLGSLHAKGLVDDVIILQRCIQEMLISFDRSYRCDLIGGVCKLLSECGERLCVTKRNHTVLERIYVKLEDIVREELMAHGVVRAVRVLVREGRRHWVAKNGVELE